MTKDPISRSHRKAIASSGSDLKKEEEYEKNIRTN